MRGIELHYAFQSFDDIPVPPVPDRKKPWGAGSPGSEGIPDFAKKSFFVLFSTPVTIDFTRFPDISFKVFQMSFFGRWIFRCAESTIGVCRGPRGTALFYYTNGRRRVGLTSMMLSVLIYQIVRMSGVRKSVLR